MYRYILNDGITLTIENNQVVGIECNNAHDIVLENGILTIDGILVKLPNPPEPDYRPIAFLLAFVVGLVLGRI
jgi:hypothetical protein